MMIRSTTSTPDIIVAESDLPTDQCGSTTLVEKMLKKQRNPIPPDTAAEVLYLGDRTCCVCNERGRAVQIHHLDEDPSNNDVDNLVALCLLCHDDTQLSGGFGRKLNEPLVRKYRTEWYATIKKRRDAVTAITSDSPPPEPPIIENPTQEELPKQARLIAYIRTLPSLRREAYKQVQPKLESGITSEMKSGCYDIIDLMEHVLATLSSWYPQGHFDQTDPKDFVNSLISSRFQWHRYHSEPLGGGTGGTMVGLDVAGSVLDEVEEMVAEMAHALLMVLPEPDPDEWLKEWRAA